MLDGQVPGASEWTGVIETANRGWLGPALYVALQRAHRLDQVPAPVREYLKLLHDRNLERNGRLREQLVEAVAAMNGRGVRPILLKGAIDLFSGSDADVAVRMISDLDLSIDPGARKTAEAALIGVGYDFTDHSNELARPDDVGTVELHGRPNMRSAPYLSRDLESSSTIVERDGAVALIPSATSRALHLIVHDMIKEGDYWRFATDLRHVYDLARLARSPGLDWAELRHLLPDAAGRGALAMQAVALHDLFGVPLPNSLCTWGARLRHSLRTAGTSSGWAGVAIRALGKLCWGVHRFAESRAWRAPADIGPRAWLMFVTPKKGSRL